MFSSVIQRLNDRRDSAGDIGEDAGFTLIELMVVLLILAILLAIAIPTFLGVTKSANDRAAQSNLNTAMLNAKASYQANAQSYGAPNTVTSTVLATAEPGVSFTSGASSGQGNVSVFPTADGNAIVLAAFTKSNNCWYQIDNPTGNTAAVAPFTLTAASVSGSGSNTPMAAPVTTVTAGALLFPGGVSGTIYVEVKGDSNAAHCNASTPVYGGTSYQWTTTAFPSI
jgi:type IV pilus assembly protein PilA